MDNSSDLDLSFQSEISILSRSRILKEFVKFKRINNSLNFLQSVSEINKSLSEIFENCKDEVNKVVNQRINSLNNLVTPERIEQINLSQIGVDLVRLSFFKDIKFSKLSPIENTL